MANSEFMRQLYKESIEKCAKREVFEETGIHIKNIRYATFTNDIFRKDQKHYVTLFVISEYDDGNLELKEPEKCEKWDWFFWDELPEPKFLPLENLLKQKLACLQIKKLVANLG